MADEPSINGAYRVGVLGAVLIVVGILTSGPLAVLAVALVQAQPAWTGPATFVENFHRVQVLPYYFGFILIAGSVLMLVSICLLTKKRAAALAGLVFVSIGAALAFLNYLTQTTFIPAVVNNYSPQSDAVIGALSMSNAISIAWAVEMWAYGFIGLGTWCAAGFFGMSGLDSRYWHGQE